MEQKSFQPILCAVLGNVIWGFGFLFTKMALKVVNAPELMLAHRFLLAAVCMTIMLLAGKKKISFKGKDLKTAGLLILAQLSYYIFESYGILHTNATISGLVLAVAPVLTVVTGALLLKEYPTKRQALFCIMPVAGVVIMTVSGKSLGVVTPLGVLFLGLTLLASVSYKTINRKASREFDTFERTYMVVICPAVMLSLIALGKVNWSFQEFVAPLSNPGYMLPVLSLGILSSIGANLLVNYATARMSVFKVASFGSISTLCSAFAGVVFLKEPVSIPLVVGAVLILIGVRQVSRPK